LTDNCVFRTTNAKPFSDHGDSNSDSFNNHTTSSPGNNFKSKAIPRPPTPVDDEFDPRAEENGDFGDFASATISKPATNSAATNNSGAATKKIVIKPLPTSSSTPAALSAGGGDEFADFQSAFGAGSSTMSENNSKSDLFTLADNTPTTSATNNSDLLGLNFDIGGQTNQVSQPPVAAAASFLSMSQVGSTSIPSGIPFGGAHVVMSQGPVSFPVSFPQNLSPVGVAPSFTNVVPPKAAPTFPIQTAAPAMAQPSSALNDLFGGDIASTPVLLPQSNHGANGSQNNTTSKNNNINNNNHHAENGTATTLKVRLKLFSSNCVLKSSKRSKYLF